MKKNKTKIDRSIDTDVLGFQVRESYKAARTNIAYSILKKGCKKVALHHLQRTEGKTVTLSMLRRHLLSRLTPRCL